MQPVQLIFPFPVRHLPYQHCKQPVHFSKHIYTLCNIKKNLQQQPQGVGLEHPLTEEEECSPSSSFEVLFRLSMPSGLYIPKKRRHAFLIPDRREGNWHALNSCPTDAWLHGHRYFASHFSPTCEQRRSIAGETVEKQDSAPTRHPRKVCSRFHPNFWSVTVMNPG